VVANPAAAIPFLNGAAVGYGASEMFKRRAQHSQDHWSRCDYINHE